MIRRIGSFSLALLLAGRLSGGPALAAPDGAAIFADLCAPCHARRGWAAPARR